MPAPSSASRAPSSRAAQLALAALAALVAGGVLDPGAPAPVPADAPADRFSAGRAAVLLEDIAREPHPTGSEASARVRGRIVRRLEELGVPHEELPWQRALEFRPAPVEGTPQDGAAGSEGPPRGEDEPRARSRLEGPRSIEGVNVVARLLPAGGDAGGPVALFVAHHDARPGRGGVGGAPGAGDDGAAVAAFLEALRALTAGPPLANELWFLFTDGEELGLLGARAFAERPGALERVAVVLNFEGRGNGGPVVLFETGRDDAAWVRAYAEAVDWPQASSLGPTVYERLPNDTDFSVFSERGLPGLNFAFIGGGSAYHQPWDTPSNLDPRSLQHHGEIVLGLARGLGRADLVALAGQRGSASFLTLPGNVLLHYPSPWDTALGGLAVLTLVGALLAGLRAGTLRGSGLALATLAFPALAAVLAALLLAGWWLVDRGMATLARATGAFADAPARGNLLSGTLTTLGLAAWAAFLLAGLARRARGPWLDTLAAGALVAWLALSLAVLSLARGAAHVLVLPLFFLALALHASLRSRGAADAAGTAAAFVWAATVPALLVLVPVLKLLGQVGSVSPLGGALLPAGLLALFAAGFVPALERIVRGAPRLTLVGTGCAALALLASASALSLSGR